MIKRLKLVLVDMFLRLLRGYIRYVPFGDKRPAWKRFDWYIWSRDLPRRDAQTRYGFKVGVKLPDMIQMVIYLTGAWESSISAYIASALKPGDVFVDIGANIGYYTLLASKAVGLTGRVYAIDASKAIFEELQRNVEINAAKNVTTLHALVAGKSETREFWEDTYANRGLSTGVASVARELGLQSTGVVRAEPLTQLVPPEDLLRARFIKVDVEGAELEVLEPLFPELGRFAAEWMLELKPGDAAQIFHAFRSAGYSAYRLHNAYAVDEYLAAPRTGPLERLSEPPGGLADVLFSRERRD